MDKVKVIITSILALAISLLFILLENYSTPTAYYGAHEVYRVYLNGKSLGIVESKEELEKYINQEQQQIKQKYGVDKVYRPKDLEIKKEVTYNTNLKSVKKIYKEIENKDDFTIKGYKITITSKVKQENTNDNKKKKEETTTQELYVLNKDDFTNAINSTVLAFIDEEKYKDYLNSTQAEIKDTGSIIENIYIKETITIKEDYLPTKEQIFTNEKDLAKYILYGNLNNQKTYKVQSGDTPQKIATANKLNINEFLVANRDLSGKDALLYEGQEVIVSLIDPIITVVEEEHVVELQETKYETVVEEDSSLYKGQSEIVRKGVNGESLVTKKTQKENGQTTNVINVSTVVVKNPVNELVKAGSKSSYVVGNGSWGWPTIQGYTLTDGYEWRWGKLHAAQDIAGLGCNSPIYAVNSGTVVTAHYHSSLGNYVEIDHNNGYKTLYAHLNRIYVSEGQGINKGDVLGLMGATGFSFGCHLHFGAYYQGSSFDPMNLYR